MKYGSLIVVGTALLFRKQILNLFRTGNAARQLVVDPESVKWLGVKGNNIKFAVKVRIKNPSKEAVKIDSMFFDFLIDSYKIAYIDKVLSDVTVKPESVSYITVEVESVAGWFLVTQLGLAILAGKLPETMTITGVLTANQLSVPVNSVTPISK